MNQLPQLEDHFTFDAVMRRVMLSRLAMRADRSDAEYKHSICRTFPKPHAEHPLITMLPSRGRLERPRDRHSRDDRANHLWAYSRAIRRGLECTPEMCDSWVPEAAAFYEQIHARVFDNAKFVFSEPNVFAEEKARGGDVYRAIAVFGLMDRVIDSCVGAYPARPLRSAVFSPFLRVQIDNRHACRCHALG